MHTQQSRDNQKLRVWITTICGVVSVIALTSLLVQMLKAEPRNNSDVCVSYQIMTNGGRRTPIGTKRCTLRLDRADTPEARELGLSGRVSMPANQGLLFVFDEIGRQCIWMKDMKFAIDIIWLNSSGDVIKLQEKATPDSYPMQYCAEDTLFVIEVNAGIARSAGLVPGKHISL